MWFVSFLLVLMTGPAAAITPASERSFTLKDSVHLAILNNARVLWAEQAVKIAEERVREAYYMYLPEFGFQANATKYRVNEPFALSPEFGSLILGPDPLPGEKLPRSRNSGRTLITARGFINYPIYIGGRGRKTVRMAKAALKQAKSEYETVKMDTELRTKQVFCKMILAQEKAQVLDRGVNYARTLWNWKKASKWEQIEGENIVNKLEDMLEASHRDLQIARLNYLKGLNLELDTHVNLIGEIKTQTVEIDLPKAISWAMEFRSELKAQAFKAEIDAIAVNLATTRRHPTVFVGADYELHDHQFPLKRRNWDATLSVRIPLSYTFRTEIRQKRAEQRQGTLTRAEMEDQVKLDMHKAHENLLHWQKTWPKREREYKRLKDLFEKALAEQKKGLAPLKGHAALLESHIAYLEAVQEHLLAIFRLERAAGRKLPRQ